MRTNRTTRRRTRARVIKFVVFVVFISLVAGVIAILSKFLKKESEPTSEAEIPVDKYQQVQISEEHQSDETSSSLEVADSVVPEVVWGIDVSHWNVELTNDPQFLPTIKAAGCQFVYIQIGKTADNSLKDYWEYAKGVAMACEDAEILYGFYYLTEADVESEMYMELWFITKFFDTLSTLDLKFNKLPFVLDFEADGKEKVEEQEQLKLLINHLHSEDIIPVIYSSESMLSKLEETLQNPNQEYWMANHALDETGIAPGQMPATMRENPRIICWQYTDDENLLYERGVNTNNQALDRNLMPYNVWAYYKGLE